MDWQSDRETITILYDGQCPICRQANDFPRMAPNICTVDARTTSIWRQQATDAGINLDRGFAVFHNDQLYAGHKAAHFLAKQLSETTGWRAAMTRFPFAGRIRSALLYPLAVWFRHAILKINGIPMIDNLVTGNTPPIIREQK